MRIGFYAPFKPLGHRHPSGDLIIATGIYDYLTQKGHQLGAASELRARWIYLKPRRWLLFLREFLRAQRRMRKLRPQLWLTYHAYYKAPDLMGPVLSRRLKIPYVIFQGIYSTKVRRKWKTWPGYILNRKALLSAQMVFTNRRSDAVNLMRLLPAKRIQYIAPGIFPDAFQFNPGARNRYRRKWKTGNTPVIFAAAMFRRGVKSQGLAWTIRICGKLKRLGIPLYLVIAGDGRKKEYLKQLAATYLPEGVRFLGKVPREEMARYYSAADLFVFPGIRESLGMVYLEAQSCGLPVVAFNNGGIPEVVPDGTSGYLTPPMAEAPYMAAVEKLIKDPHKRKQMSAAAQRYVRQNHDLDRNYAKLDMALQAVAEQYAKARRHSA